MPNSAQPDLFDDLPRFEPNDAVSAEPLNPEKMSDDALISAIPDATLADAHAASAEAGKRGLAAAAPRSRLSAIASSVGAPTSLCLSRLRRSTLGVIGGPEAAHAVFRLISKRIVQGPTLVTATTVASQLRVVFPSDVVLALLRHSNPLVRAAACACVNSGYEVITTLIAMLDDPDGEVTVASACALGRMGRPEALAHLKRHLVERPSPRVVEALARVADDEAIVFLARAGRARRDLAACVTSALEEIDSARALSAASALKKFAAVQSK